MARKPKRTNEVSFNRYHSIWEMRADGWISLTDDLGRMTDLSRESAEYDARKARVQATLATLRPVESYWAFPGRRLFDDLVLWFEAGDLNRVQTAVRRINRMLANRSYRHQVLSLDSDVEGPSEIETEEEVQAQISRPYFEVLIVDEMSVQEEEALRRRVQRKRRPDDAFVFDIVVVPSFEDALIATLFNFNLQACVIRHGFPFRSDYRLDLLRKFLDGLDEDVERRPESERGPLLGAKIAELRPEIDLYLVTDLNPEEIAMRVGDIFQRVFKALKDFAKQPPGVFHALPVARGKSIMNSNWIQDVTQFYGINLFMAETSATSGGLDSLLDPVGPLKRAQECAARAFGAKRTFFATNGTSTANKIVVQALIRPGDIVLIDRAVPGRSSCGCRSAPMARPSSVNRCNAASAMPSSPSVACANIRMSGKSALRRRSVSSASP